MPGYLELSWLHIHSTVQSSSQNEYPVDNFYGRKEAEASEYSEDAT